MFKAKVEPIYKGVIGVDGEGYSTKPANAVASTVSELYGNEHGGNGSHFVKKGTPYGEAAMFNSLPPGENLFNQELSDLERTGSMKFKELVDSRGFQHGGN